MRMRGYKIIEYSYIEYKKKVEGRQGKFQGKSG